MLDGLRFDAELGTSGERAGGNGADGKYVEPKAHIIITTQTILARWLRAHKDWWDKGLKNVPQQIAAALKDESFYTQAMSTDAAVVNFDPLPIAKPASATFAYGMLAGPWEGSVKPRELAFGASSRACRSWAPTSLKFVDLAVRQILA
jgi:hypothetical protein